MEFRAVWAKLEVFFPPAWFPLLFPSQPHWWSRTSVWMTFHMMEAASGTSFTPLWPHRIVTSFLVYSRAGIVKTLLLHAELQCFVGKSSVSQCMERRPWPCLRAVKGKDLELRGCVIIATPMGSTGRSRGRLSSTDQVQNANHCSSTAVGFTCSHFTLLFLYCLLYRVLVLLQYYCTTRKQREF